MFHVAFVVRTPILALTSIALAMSGQFCCAGPMEFTGTVIQVINGETIIVRENSGRVHRVLINWIDAPEPEQKWSNESKDSLKKDVLGKIVRVVPYRDEPTLPSDIYLEEVFLSEKRLRDGWAWQYKPYSTQQNLADAEAEARVAKRGMWRDGNLQSPWEYRKAKKDTISWDNYLADCGLRAQEANEAKTEKVFREKYQGKQVRWSGVVDSVKEKPLTKGYLIDVRMTPTESEFGLSDVTLWVSEEFAGLVLSLNKDDEITFSGKLMKQGGRILNHYLELHDVEVDSR